MFNATQADIDLNGMTIQYKTTGKKIDAGAGVVVIKAGAYALIGVSTDKSANGGVDIAWQLSGVAFANTSGSLALLADGVQVDAVSYKSSAPFPSLPKDGGASVQLKTTAYDTKKNDDGANWCLSTATFGNAGYKGTPGKANDCQ